MKTPKFIFPLFFLLSCSDDGLKPITLDETKLCIPVENIREPFFSRSLLESMENFDESIGEQIIFSASEVMQGIPTYNPTSINAKGIEIENNISGILWPSSYIGSGSADEAAWDQYNKPNTLIEMDSDLPLYRMYPYDKVSFNWKYIRSLPKTNEIASPPVDWLIGNCSKSEIIGFTSCYQNARYKSTFFQYEIRNENILLNEEIRNFVIKIFREWEGNCAS